MLLTVSIVILLAFALAIGVVIRKSHSNNNASVPEQTPLPLSRWQAKTDIEAALEFEAYDKETTYDNMINFAEQYHNDIEKAKNEIQSGLIHVQKENQMHIKKANDKMQDWIKDLLHAQRIKLQEFIQLSNDKLKQEMKSEIQSAEQHIQRDLRIMRQFVKEEIQKATLKASPKGMPKIIPKATSNATTAAETSIEPKKESLENQLNTIEMTENQLQINIFNELTGQLADAQKTMAQIHAHLEMLQLLHAMESDFKNQALFGHE
ncbi:hypothetical protein [Cohnella thailandensis]|uniref:Uncharacterized protein n=1 Tax=Cohnella thailandensis TaxID=557557 RepID=A0A841T377_9BACL|nr:hypothetical protein [Cohnella thailandensis]MBB6637065.1 hypothetical protein [Cohnella thailandensis]MBP1973047.1 putative coiled-coil protein SlyX [Cohnella thailandensis]